MSMVRLNPASNPVRTSTVSGAQATPELTPAVATAEAAEAQPLFATDTFEPAQRTSPLVHLAAAEGPAGQRERALEVTRQSPPGSVGAAIRPILDGTMTGLRAGGSAAGTALGSLVPGLGPFLGPVLGRQGGALAREFAAGAVGDFYEQNRALLHRPATDANILEFSQRETEFFRTQSAVPRVVGSALSAEQRAGLIRFSRDHFAE
jgi:hypothetical protein